MLARVRPDVRRPAALAALVAVLAALALSAVPSSFGGRLGVDEPQYVLSALGLAEDRDLDVSDELRQARWADFREPGVGIPQQTQPRDDGSRISPHDPLLPLLLAGPVGLAERLEPSTGVGMWAGARSVMVLTAGLLAAAVVVVGVRGLGVAPRPAAAGAALAGASSPLAFYGAQVYPELPAALVTVVAAGALLRLHPRTSAGGAPSAGVRRAAAAVVVVGVVALPWLGVKYGGVAAALAALLLWRLRARRAEAGAVVGVLAASGAVYLAVHRAVWGGWTVYASGDHFVDSGELGVVGFAPDHVGRTMRLASLLLDRDFGLVAWQPAWLALVAALAWLVRARPAGWEVLALPLAAGWATATWVALTAHGYWWSGRQLVVVLPLAVLVVLLWLRERDAAARAAGRAPWATRVVAAAAVLGVVTTAWFVADGLAGYVTPVSGADRVGDPLHQALRRALPDYRVLDAGDWARHALWSAVLLGLAVTGWRTASRRAAGGPSGPRTAPPAALRGPRGPSRRRRAASVVATGAAAAVALPGCTAFDDGARVRDDAPGASTSPRPEDAPGRTR